MTATTTKRHPIRGFFYGIVFGLGLALVAIGQKWAALGTWPPFILLIVGIIIGTVWSTYGPAKAPKGPDPTAPAPAPEPPVADPEPEASADAADAADAADDTPTDAEALET